MSHVVEIADLAAEQWGLVTAAQARTHGISVQTLARLAQRGVLERTTHGVYRVTGTPPEHLDDLRAAWLALDPTAMAAARRRGPATPEVVSHRSAARVHGLGDLEADELEFTTPARKQTRRDDVRLHRSTVYPGEWTVVDGLPVTTVVRTITDLAAARVDGGHLARVVRDALTVHQVDDQQLIAALRPYAHHYGEPAGDASALVATLLRTAGVSTSLERAVELADSASVARAVPSATQLEGIQRALESIQRQIAQTAISLDPEPIRRVQEMVAASIEPQMLTVQEMIAASIEPHFRKMQEIVAESLDREQLRTIAAVAELAALPQFPALEATQGQAARARDPARADRQQESDEDK